MSAEKLSVSFDAELAETVRSAAAEAGVSVSTWLADAAQAKARLRRLRSALDAFAHEFGELADDEVDRLVAEARRDSVVTRPARP